MTFLQAGKKPLRALTGAELLRVGEDQEFLIRNQALADPGRIRSVETGMHVFQQHCSQVN